MAGPLSKRDIEMIFRAETDTATRDIKTLKKSVTDLRKQLLDQTEAANRGEGSLEELAKTTRELKAAQDELGTARSLLTTLNSQSGAVDRQAARLEKLRAEYSELETRMKGAEQPTKRLQNSFEAKGRAVSQATERLDRENAALAETKAQIEAIIGPVGNFEDAFRDIATTSRDAARGLAIAGEAADTLKAKMASAQAGGASDAAFANMAARSPVSAESIAFIEQFENRVELLRLEESALEAQRKGDALAERARKQQQLDDIARLVAGNDALEAEFARLAAEQERVAKVSAFTRIAHDARLAAADVGRVQSTFRDTADTANRLSSAILEIVNPAQAAANDLGRVGEAIDKAEDALQAKKPLRLAEYQTALNELDRSIAGLQRSAAQIDGLRAQEAAVAQAEAKWNEARVTVDDLASKMIQAGEGGEAFAADLKRAEAASATAATELQRQRTRLDEMGAAARRAGIDIRDLAAAEKQLTAEAQRASVAQQGLESKTGRAGGGRGFLGLNPNELQNLGYQVNDVFTSLASGIPITQVLAQQGGQIFQLFPGAFTAMASMLPVIIPLAIALGVAFAATSKALDEISRKKAAEGLLASLGETSGYTAERMVEAENALKSFGATSEDAQAAVETFVREGINPEALDAFTIAAQNMADVTGKTVPEAADLMTAAFTGSKDEVLALDDQFHFLSDAERDHIRDMDESTQQAEIRRYAFERFYDRMQDGADKMNGPWKQATDTWRVTWNTLLEAVGAGEGTITSMINYISEAILGVTRLVNIVKEVKGQFDAYAAGGGLWGSIRGTNNASIDFGAAVEAADKRTIAAYQASQRRFNQALPAGGVDPGKGSRGAQGLKEDKEDKDKKKADKDAKAAARRAAAEAKRRQREAEQLERQYQNMQDSLTASLNRMTASALRNQQTTVEQQISNARQAVDEQFASLLDQISEFEKKFPGRTINGMTPAQYREQIDRNKAILKDAATLKTYEENINDILQERSRRLADIQEQVQSGEITPEEGMRKTEEVTSEVNARLAEAIQKARDFAVALNAVNPSPELSNFIAKLDSAQRTVGSGLQNTTGRQQANQLRDIADTRVNSIVQQRNALIQAQQALVEAGAITNETAQKRIATAYAQTTPEIVKQIAAYRALIQAQLAAKLIDPIEAQRILAELDLIQAETVYVADNIRQVNTAARDAFGQGVVNMMNTFAEGLVGLIDGSKSLGDFFSDLGNAALNFAAMWLKAIADVLVQMLALQAVKAIFGGGFGGGIGGLIFHGGTGGGGVGGYSKGTRTRSSFGNLSPAVLDVIPRYHNGNPGVGLQPNEQLAILEKGEQVLTEEQQRRKAAGGGGPASVNLRQVLLLEDSEIAGAMASPAGENATMTTIRRNKTAIRQELGID